MVADALPSPSGRRWPGGPDEGSVGAGFLAPTEPSPQPLSRRERGFKAERCKGQTLGSPSVVPGFLPRPMTSSGVFEAPYKNRALSGTIDRLSRAQRTTSQDPTHEPASQLRTDPAEGIRRAGLSRL